jgi:hypothetical protein
MLFGETIAAYCENHKEHTDTLRGQIKGIFKVTESAMNQKGLRTETDPVSQMLCFPVFRILDDGLKSRNPVILSVKEGGTYTVHPH